MAYNQLDPIPMQQSQPWWQRPTSQTVLIASLAVSLISGAVFGMGGAFWITKGRLPTLNELQHLSTTLSVDTNGRVAGSSTTSVQETSATTEVVEKVSPAVVSIITKQDLSKIRQQPNSFFDPFGFFSFSSPQQTQPKTGTQQISAGSGFLISSDGLVMTNKHVVSDVVNDPSLELTVIFNDGSEHTATIVDTDPLNDLAVLKIDGKNLPVVALGDSDSLKLGQTVIAIGNALGENNTVTRGVVSGINRTIQASDQQGSAETIDEAIQTDAAINHGNSGGPLLNLSGEVIGVNTAINEQGQNVGFAIPVNAAKQIIDSVRTTGSIVRPYLGVRYLVVDQSVKQANNLSVDYGALVQRGTAASDVAVIPSSPADKAGIVENDIILEFNGEKLSTDKPLTSFMRKVNVGDTITLKILHKGDQKTVSVKLEALKKSSTSTNAPQ